MNSYFLHYSILFYPNLSFHPLLETLAILHSVSMAPKPSQPIENKLEYIKDTKVGPFTIHDIQKRLCSSEKSPISRKVIESALSQARSYPSVVACPEIVPSCVQHYHPDSQEIRGANQNLIAKIDANNISLALHLPKKEGEIDLSFQLGWKYFHNQTD